MAEENIIQKKVKVLRKITPQRLKNIALYYLKRFESSVANLRSVLQRRVNDYAYQNKEFDRGEAYQWIEDILADFQRYGYLNDSRYAEIKIKDYMSAGKSVRYIKGKMREKGIDEEILSALLEDQEYDEFEAALKLAKKKHIGPFRTDEEARFENRQKDMGTLVRAGFSYDVVRRVVGYEE
ncbi:regulatory protein RecX [Proteobacteria bacterium CAG:495]|nr:regulatory protein RecX [Proteobacteria bacterium CAG:495]